MSNLNKSCEISLNFLWSSQTMKFIFDLFFQNLWYKFTDLSWCKSWFELYGSGWEFSGCPETLVYLHGRFFWQRLQFRWWKFKSERDWKVSSLFHFCYTRLIFLKVSKFQNEFTKSSFLPKYEQKNCQDFFPVYCRAEILTIFRSYFGRNDDFINSFWNLLTFRM